MSHEVETMMYAKQTPWHGLGTYVGEKAIKSNEAIIQAGLDWEVAECQMIGQLPRIKTETLNEINYEIPEVIVPDHKAIIRTFDKKVLGVVGKNYSPVQNLEAFDFCDSLVEDGTMKYHTAGSLRGGKRIWMLGQIGSFEVVENDTVDQYILLINAHDGSMSFRAMWTTVRVVCANTMRLALAAGAGSGVYLRHTGNIGLRIQQAKNALGIAREQHDVYADFTRALAAMPMTDQMWNEFMEHVLPVSDEASEIVIERANDTRNRLLYLFANGTGQDNPAMKNSGWAALNAVTEFVNFEKKTNAGNGMDEQGRRFESSLLGPGDVMIQKAMWKLGEFINDFRQ